MDHDASVSRHLEHIMSIFDRSPVADARAWIAERELFERFVREQLARLSAHPPHRTRM